MQLLFAARCVLITQPLIEQRSIATSLSVCFSVRSHTAYLRNHTIALDHIFGACYLWLWLGSLLAVFEIRCSPLPVAAWQPCELLYTCYLLCSFRFLDDIRYARSFPSKGVRIGTRQGSESIRCLQLLCVYQHLL